MFPLGLKVRKLTILPVQNLPDIMTRENKEGKTPLFDMLMDPTLAPEALNTESMVIVSVYELLENPEKGVFC